MNTILEKLHEDHKNFNTLLMFLKEQLVLLKELEHVEFELILAAIHYMKEYPDHIHHPLENIIFRYYLEHYSEANKTIEELLEEHEQMPLLTDTLQKMLKCVLMDMPQERAKLCAYLEEYIETQKEHMNVEEGQVYPALRANMTNADWEKIKSELAGISDPLFGKLIKDTYKPLFNYITVQPSLKRVV